MIDKYVNTIKILDEYFKYDGTLECFGHIFKEYDANASFYYRSDATIYCDIGFKCLDNPVGEIEMNGYDIPLAVLKSLYLSILEIRNEQPEEITDPLRTRILGE